MMASPMISAPPLGLGTGTILLAPASRSLCCQGPSTKSCMQAGRPEAHDWLHALHPGGAYIRISPGVPNGLDSRRLLCAKGRCTQQNMPRDCCGRADQTCNNTNKRGGGGGHTARMLTFSLIRTV